MLMKYLFMLDGKKWYEIKGFNEMVIAMFGLDSIELASNLMSTVRSTSVIKNEKQMHAIKCVLLADTKN